MAWIFIFVVLVVTGALAITILVNRGRFERRVEGTQLFTANPPGFVWTGRIRMAPDVWIDARDMALAGKGSMRVLLDDTVTLVDARGPQLDQGSALRLLAEMVWYPTSLFDSRSVTWSAIDAECLQTRLAPALRLLATRNSGLRRSSSARSAQPLRQRVW